MKDIQYLTHDLGARNDPKLMDLQMDMGGQGLGIFWCLVELLWENGGYIPANYKSIAFALRWCKPAEVEKVVNGYGLFQVEDGMITSRSAMERIAAKQAKFEAHSGAGKKGAERRWNSGANGSANGNANSSAMAAPMPLTNLHTNKQKDNNNNAPTALDIEEIFFFKNFINPSGEVARFLKYYEERDWTYQDGTPVENWEQAARDWKPAKAGTRFNQEALNWYKAVWNAARGRIENAGKIFIVGIDKLDLSGQKLTIRYTSLNTAQLAAKFIQENDLAGDYIIDFRVRN